MNYADPFGIQESTPLSRALRSIDLIADVQLNWPTGYLGADYLASINLVIPGASGLNIILPSALEANEGTGFLVVNKGNFAFSVKDFGGSVVTGLQPGQAKYLFCVANTDNIGTWNSITFGQGNSYTDALELAGLGLTSKDGKLNAGFAISTTSSDVNVSGAYRSRVIVNVSGSITVNFPQYTDVDGTFFFGVHNGGSGTVTLQPSTGNLVDDFTSLALAPNESVFVFSSGGPKWYTVGYGRSTQFQFTKLVKDVSAGGAITLTSAEASNKLLQFIGDPASNVVVTIPSVVGIYYVQNTYSGAYSLTIKTSTGSGLALNSGDRAILYCDGVDVVSAQSVAVGVSLSVVDGSLNTPSIAFSSDSNTGIYKSDIGTLGIVSDGAEAARFNAVASYVAGAFGIRTIAPAAPLHVLSNASTEICRFQGDSTYVTFYNSDGTSRNAYIQAISADLRISSDAPNGITSFYSGGTKMMEINSTGVKVFGTMTDNTSGQSTNYATLAGNTFTGIQVAPVFRTKIKQLGNVSGTLNIDISQGNTFTMTCIGATTINFAGAPASGIDQVTYLKIVNSNITWGTMCRFTDSGLRPAQTTSGKDIYAVWYDPEDAVYVIGRAFKDYK